MTNGGRGKTRIVDVATGRLAFLDALRGIAALAVIVRHIGAALGAGYNALFDFGYLGVVVFFLCSGFIIPASLARLGAVRPFWRNRVFRLYPLYWFSLLGALLLAAAGRLPLDEAFLERPVLAALANLTMLQRFAGLPDALIVYWTLGYEMIFYALVSLLFATGLLRRGAFVAVCFLVATSLLGAVPSLGTAELTATIFYLATMFVGMVVYKAWAAEIPAPVAGGVVALALLTIAVTCVPGLWTDQAREAGRRLSAWLAAYALCGAALLARHRRFPRALLGLGTISYSLYLIHPLVISAIPRVGGVFPTLLCWSTAILLLSLATYRWIERPFIALGRRTNPGGRGDTPATHPPQLATSHPHPLVSRTADERAAEVA